MDLLRAIKAELLQIVVIVAALALVGWLVWRKIFGGASVDSVVGNTITSTTQLIGGLPSYLGSTLRGENEGTYITFAEQKRLADAALARKRAGSL
jgi:hypothetical protein